MDDFSAFIKKTDIKKTVPISLRIPEYQLTLLNKITNNTVPMSDIMRHLICNLLSENEEIKLDYHNLLLDTKLGISH